MTLNFLPPEVESAWRLGGLRVLCAALRRLVEESPHPSAFMCPDCLGSGREPLIGTSTPSWMRGSAGPCDTCRGNGVLSGCPCPEAHW